MNKEEKINNKLDKYIKSLKKYKNKNEKLYNLSYRKFIKYYNLKYEGKRPFA